MLSHATTRILILMMGFSLWMPLLPAQEPENLSEFCTACHDEKLEALKKSTHWPSFETRIDTGYIGCQACHWPGEAHAEDPSNPQFAFRKEPAHEQSGRCLKCHQKYGVGQAIHVRQGLACVACHVSGHGETTSDIRTALLRKADPELCLSCHAKQKAQLQLPFHHKVTDGPLVCTDCHDPHASSGARSRVLMSNRECVRCHADKQGPFTFEHLSRTVTGCQSCHEPHGTTNPRLLVRSEVRFLCLECHGNTPRFHDLSQSRFQNCTVCHTAIHGSHMDRKFLR